VRGRRRESERTKDSQTERLSTHRCSGNGQVPSPRPSPRTRPHAGRGRRERRLAWLLPLVVARADLDHAAVAHAGPMRADVPAIATSLANLRQWSVALVGDAASLARGLCRGGEAGQRIQCDDGDKQCRSSRQSLNHDCLPSISRKTCCRGFHRIGRSVADPRGNCLTVASSRNQRLRVNTFRACRRYDGPSGVRSSRRRSSRAAPAGRGRTLTPAAASAGRCCARWRGPNIRAIARR
jgi:hypothetical protein